MGGVVTAALAGGRHMADILRGFGGRDCHGFTNPSRVMGTGYQGMGWGWQIPTLEKPAPGTRVAWAGLTGAR